MVQQIELEEKPPHRPSMATYKSIIESESSEDENDGELNTDSAAVSEQKIA